MGDIASLLRTMSTPKNNPDQPDYKNSAFQRMAPALTVVRDVSGGTARMRECGPTYLPQEPGETADEYSIRKQRSTFLNVYKKTVNAFVGMVFKDDPKLGDDVQDRIRSEAENIDLAGTHLDVFVKDVFTSAFEGHAFILVDMGPALPDGATYADEIASGRRPYWVKYTKDQALNWQTAKVNGEQVLTQITFEECSVERSGRFGEESTVRYRVFEVVNGVVRWELYRKIKDKDGKEVIVREDQGVTTLPRIPVAVVYGHRTGFLESEPPLLDLAYQNIDHWQQTSDYKTQLHALVPILVIKGCPKEEQKTMMIGPGVSQHIPSDGAIEYVSHDGKALEATRHAIVDVEQRMAQTGLSIMSQRSDSNITATEKKIDQSERTSELSTMARSLKDCIESCLGFHAQYLGVADENGDGGSVELGVAESDLALDGSIIVALDKLVTEGRLTLQTFLTTLQRGGLSSIDVEEEIKNLEASNPFKGQVPQVPELALMNQGMNTILGSEQTQ